jgi:hypothetical protein
MRGWVQQLSEYITFNIHTRGNKTMRNIYTSMALGSYRKVSQIGHNKNIRR